MSATLASDPVLAARDLRKSFQRSRDEVVQALSGVSLEAPRGRITALVGPDGAGKTTLIRLATGLLDPDSGTLRVLGLDTVTNAHEVQSRVAYMPQRFGLYEDLTVQENLDLYADLHGVLGEARDERYRKLMDMTALGSFRDRLTGRLSGGMKQKLGLACTLIRLPQLLLLDEPTVGVDPLSRRDLWAILSQLVREGLTVLLSTPYLDEAERCDHVVILHRGKVLLSGHPSEANALAAARVFRLSPQEGQTARALQARLLDDRDIIDAVPEGGRVRVVLYEARPSGEATLLGTPLAPAVPRFEDGFMVLLGRVLARPGPVAAPVVRPPGPTDGEAVVRVRGLVCRFGTFTAVDHVSFEVRRGEVFGLLGPNGAGKTTTFRTLCGLLPATGGEVRVAGGDLRAARAPARTKIGYMAQRFSLYGQLSVAENLDFFASAYGLHGARKRERIRWALEQHELVALASVQSRQLPGGYKQRLAMAVALMHEPEILFLDEATSGADPLARRDFWRRIHGLAEAGVTVIVTTHFLEEAEFCDRIAILDQGRIVAQGTPGEVRRRAPAAAHREPTMEDAFIAIVEDARSSSRAGAA